MDLSCVHAEIVHRLGGVRYADEVLLDDLTGTGAVGDGALREAQRIEGCDGVLLLVEADLAQGLEDAVKINVAFAEVADVRMSADRAVCVQRSRVDVVAE